jgi:hypothetical protein
MLQMRLKILFLFVVICVPFNSHSQSFAPIGSEWYYRERFAFMGDIDYVKFYAQKDTIINNQSCRKVIKRHRIDCLERGYVEYFYTRNDSVFYFEKDIDDFQLLYDFSAEKGDSWTIKLVNRDTPVMFAIQVDSTSITTINNIDLKTLHVTYVDPDSTNYKSIIVDRIGDLDYMFNWQHWFNQPCDANLSAGLSCYSDSIVGLYSLRNSLQCDYINSLAPTETKHSIYVYPNPTKNIIHISTSSPDTKEVDIFNLNGNLLCSEIISSDYTINLENMPDGHYFIVVKIKGTIIRTELIQKITIN